MTSLGKNKKLKKLDITTSMDVMSIINEYLSLKSTLIFLKLNFQTFVDISLLFKGLENTKIQELYLGTVFTDFYSYKKEISRLFLYNYSIISSNIYIDKYLKPFLNRNNIQQQIYKFHSKIYDLQFKFQ